MDSKVRGEVVGFVVENFLFGDAARTPADDDSLLELGVIDSTGILELIEFLEEHFGIEVSDSDTVPANLGSIASITDFVGRKTA